MSRLGLPTVIVAGFLVGWQVAPSAVSDEIADQLAVVSQVGPEGQGSMAAGRARDQLLRNGIEIAPRLLDALDTSNIVAANWFRSIFDEIVAREFQRPEPQWPLEYFQNYVRNDQHQGRSRRLVLGLIDRLEPTFGPQFLPTRLEDPEFRNDAVEWALREGDRLRQQQQLDQARSQFRTAFTHARESQHVLSAARKLQEVGESVDPVQHLGFVTHWYLLGPFAAPGTSGFDLKLPPEERVGLGRKFLDANEREQTYSGMNERPVKWTAYTTSNALGEINLIDAIAGVREAVGYAYTEIQSPREQSAELRCSADDNLTVWLNGERVLAQRQWLNGTRSDRFIAPVKLRTGVNQVLVKICQGPQHVNPDVPNNWSFQLRFCDATGASVGCRDALPK